MKVITCAGYYRTGSSAVTDLFSEFRGCANVGSLELRFIYDRDGIRDLEYGIVENNDRLNTSISIKRFMRFAKILNGGLLRRGYRRFFGDSFMKYTSEFMNQIIELKCPAWSHLDRFDIGIAFNCIDVILEKISFYLKENSRFSLLKLMKTPSYYSAIDEKQFCQYAAQYIEKVICSLGREETEFYMIDQLLPPSNLKDYLKYFNDIKIVVVDRDPRDLFILENEIYRWGNIPYKNVRDFCSWYEITRRHRKKEVFDEESVYFLRFEDLVYHYEQTIGQLINFTGLHSENHLYRKTKFNPDISIRNTNMKARYPKYSEDIKYIEKYLDEYLYDFPEVKEFD